MTEILIAEPKPNPDYLAAFSYNDSEAHKAVREYFPSWGITPQTHPKVADICAGDGSWARLLVENGWDPKNILCVDMYKSYGSLVEDATWKYWDVAELGDRLFATHFGIDIPKDIPDEIAVYQGKFDLVIVLLGVERYTAKRVANYLVKPGGKTYI